MRYGWAYTSQYVMNLNSQAYELCVGTQHTGDSLLPSKTGPMFAAVITIWRVSKQNPAMAAK
jgi:hypothetical protein